MVGELASEWVGTKGCLKKERIKLKEFKWKANAWNQNKCRINDMIHYQQPRVTETFLTFKSMHVKSKRQCFDDFKELIKILRAILLFLLIYDEPTLPLTLLLSLRYPKRTLNFSNDKPLPVQNALERVHTLWHFFKE
jgi:hypothetical protein